jgi:hypothetical protein
MAVDCLDFSPGVVRSERGDAVALLRPTFFPLNWYSSPAAGILQVDQLSGTIWLLLIEVANDNDIGVGTMVRSCPDRLTQYASCRSRSMQIIFVRWLFLFCKLACFI